MGECKKQFDSVVAELERISAHDDANSPEGPVYRGCAQSSHVDLDGRAAGAEQRARDAAQRAREAEQRAREAEARLTAMANKDNLSQSEVEISVNIGLLKSGADAEKIKAAAALEELAEKNPNNKIGEMGGIPPLVAAMASSTTNHENLAAMAALALMRLLHNGRNGDGVEVQNEKKIVEANGIPLFVKLLSYGQCDIMMVPTKNIATRALFNISMGDNEEAIVEAGGIPPLVAILQSGTDEAKVYACNTLHNLSCMTSCSVNHDIHARKIVAAGGIPLLVTLLTRTVAAVDVLCNLARLDNHKVMITAAGAIPPLVEMLKNQHKQAAALKLLYRLAKNDANKMTIGSAGSIPPFFAIVKEGRTEQALGVPIFSLAGDVLRLLKQDANIAPMIQSENETWYADDSFVISPGGNGWMPEEPAVNVKGPMVKLFEYIDKNGNGLITKDEILDALGGDNDVGVFMANKLNIDVSWHEQGGGTVHNLEAVFQDMDKDGSSEVDLVEFANYFYQVWRIPGYAPFKVEMKNGQLVMKSGSSGSEPFVPKTESLCA